MCMCHTKSSRPRKLQKYYYKVMELRGGRLYSWACASEYYAKRRWYKAMSLCTGNRGRISYTPCFHVFLNKEDAQAKCRYIHEVVVKVRCKHFMIQGTSVVKGNKCYVDKPSYGFKYQYIIGVV